MKIGYANATNKGQNLESQLQALEKESCDEIFSEKFKGTKTDRPEFKKVISSLKEGDTLVVTKLDCLACTTIEGIQTIRELFERGVRVHILNTGLVENTPLGRLVFNIMSAFAEYERDTSVQRVGRPDKFSEKQIKQALGLLKTHSYEQVQDLTGISKSTLIRAKNKEGLK